MNKDLQNSDLFYTDELNKMQKNAAWTNSYITPTAESILMELFPQHFDLEVLWYIFSFFPDEYWAGKYPFSKYSKQKLCYGSYVHVSLKEHLHYDQISTVD